jgi:hypothetical protein
METDKYPTRFKPGQVANPKGRPVSARQRIAEKLVADIADKWETHGRPFWSTWPPMSRLSSHRSLTFCCRKTSSPGDLTPAEWASLRRVIDLIGRYAAAGAEPEPIFEQIERALQLAYEPRAIPPCPVPLPATETASASNAKNRTI